MTKVAGELMIENIHSCWIGSELARRLGLNSRFFSRMTRNKPKSLSRDIYIQSTGGIVLVKIPNNISKMLRDGDYVAKKVEDENDDMFDYIFAITAETKIGLWK